MIKIEENLLIRAIVKYKNNYYSINNNDFLDIVEERNEILIDENIENEIKKIYTIIELINKNNENHLIFSDIFVKIENGKFLGFYKEEKMEFIYNFETSQGFIKNEEFFENLKDFNSCISFSGDNNLFNITKYINDILKTNLNVKEFCFKYFYRKKYSKLLNLAKLLTTNLIEIEKLICSGNENLFLNSLENNDIVIEKGKKINQVIKLPKFCLDFIKKYKVEKLIPIFQKIANDFDGNTLKIIIDMIENFEIYNKKNKRIQEENVYQFKTFFETIYFLLSNGFKITDLLNYALKQRMYWSKNKLFNLPIEEIKLLKDYYNMSINNGFSFEKYPQNLNKMHDIIIKNMSCMDNQENCDKFEKVVKNYNKKDIIIEDYIFTAPKNIKELIDEGNQLHHCIASYVVNINNKVSEIYFMRNKKHPEESFVTIELNPTTKDLVEFKTDYNIEPTDKDIITLVKKFEKEKKKDLF